MKVALFSNIFKNDPLKEVAKIASNIGYHGVEIQARSHLPLESSLQQVKEAKKIMDAYGLEVPVIYTRLNGNYVNATTQEASKMLDQIKRFAEISDEIGAKMLCHSPGGPSPSAAREEDFEKAGFWMTKVAAECAQARLKVVMEIHHRGLVETVDSSLKLMNLIEEKNAGLVLDPGNMAIANEPYGEIAINQLSEHLLHVHVKDVLFYKQKPDDRIVGEYEGRFFSVELMGNGDVDHQPVYDALLKKKYEGYVTLEAQVQGLTPEEIANHEFDMYQKAIR